MGQCPKVYSFFILKASLSSPSRGQSVRHPLTGVSHFPGPSNIAVGQFSSPSLSGTGQLPSSSISGVGQLPSPSLSSVGKLLSPNLVQPTLNSMPILFGSSAGDTTDLLRCPTQPIL